AAAAPRCCPPSCAGSCFFFSSRRRHTSFSRDWSSDVCSSDLVPFHHDDLPARLGAVHRQRLARLAAADHQQADVLEVVLTHGVSLSWSARATPACGEPTCGAWAASLLRVRDCFGVVLAPSPEGRSTAPRLRQGPVRLRGLPVGAHSAPRGASSSSAARGPLPEGGRGRDDGEGGVHPPEAVVLAGPRGVGGV